jgi:hypothetical protein
LLVAGCGSRDANDPLPNWGYVIVDNTTNTASAAFYRGAGLDPASDPITQTDDCVAFPADRPASVATAVDGGTVTIYGAEQVDLTGPAYTWTGTAALSVPGQALGVNVQGSLDVAPVNAAITSPYPIEVLTPASLADGLTIDPSAPFTLSWSASDCTLGFRLWNDGVSLECAWPGTRGSAKIPPQLLGLLHSSAPSPAMLSVDCANWVHATASDWAFTLSVHTFYEKIAVTVE